MDIISYHHNLDDQVLVKLKRESGSAARQGNFERWLEAIDGIRSVHHNAERSEISIFFDKQRIDALSILNLLGYSGPFIGFMQQRTMPQPV